MEKREVKFGDWINAGFKLFQENALVLILASLVAMVLSGVTSGVLAGPMLAGMVIIIRGLQQKQEPKPEVGDIFKGFQFFVPSFLLFLFLVVASFVVMAIQGFIPCIGFILFMFYAIIVNAFVLFAIFFIVDKKMDCVAAVKASFEVITSNLWPFMGFSVVVGVIGSVGTLFCGIGSVITIPIAFCIVAVAYEEITQGSEPVAIEAEATEIKQDDTPAEKPESPTSGE